MTKNPAAGIAEENFRSGQDVRTRTDWLRFGAASLFDGAVTLVTLAYVRPWWAAKSQEKTLRRIVARRRAVR